MLRVPFRAQEGRIAAENKLRSSTNNIQILQGILRNSRASCSRRRAKPPSWGGACSAGGGWTRGSLPRVEEGRGRGGGGEWEPERGGAGAARRRSPGLRFRSPVGGPAGDGGGAGSSGSPGWPQAGSRAKGAGGLGGPWQGGALLRGPRGGPTHGADAHSRSDNPPAVFSQHLVHAVPPVPLKSHGHPEAGSHLPGCQGRQSHPRS